MEEINLQNTFNQKICKVLKDLLVKESNQPKKSASCGIFVQLKHPVQSFIKGVELISLNDNPNESPLSVIITINELRILLLANFMAKLMNERVDIFVNTQGSCPYEFETKLKKIFQYFQLEKNLNLKLLNDSFNENRLSFEQKLRNLKTNYLAEPNIVDFTKILNDFDLKFYDQNLHYGNISQYKKDAAELSIAYQDFLSRNTTNRLLNLCFSSEFFQRQRNDLITRVLLDDPKKYSLSYVCIGKSLIDWNSKENDALFQLDAKEKQFRYSAEQRNLISDAKSEFNIANFTKFSITYEMLCLGVHNDIKRMDIFDKTSQTEPRSDPSSFILYNCARLHAIIEKFKNIQNTGIYKSLPAVEELNFYKIFNSSYEKKICTSFLFEYENVLNELRQGILMPADNSIQTKVNTPKLLRFLSDLSNLFSKYYSKIHVLEDPKLVHLHETMYCRIYLLNAIYNLFKLVLDLFNIDPLFYTAHIRSKYQSSMSTFNG